MRFISNLHKLYRRQVYIFGAHIHSVGVPTILERLYAFSDQLNSEILLLETMHINLKICVFLVAMAIVLTTSPALGGNSASGKKLHQMISKLVVKDEAGGRTKRDYCPPFCCPPRC